MVKQSQPIQPGTIQWGLHYRINQRQFIHSRFKGENKGIVANMAVYKGIDPSNYLIDDVGRAGNYFGEIPRPETSQLPTTLKLIKNKRS